MSTANRQPCPPWCPGTHDVIDDGRRHPEDAGVEHLGPQVDRFRARDASTPVTVDVYAFRHDLPGARDSDWTSVRFDGHDSLGEPVASAWTSEDARRLGEALIRAADLLDGRIGREALPWWTCPPWCDDVHEGDEGRDEALHQRSWSGRGWRIDLQACQNRDGSPSWGPELFLGECEAVRAPEVPAFRTALDAALGWIESDASQGAGNVTTGDVR